MCGVIALVTKDCDVEVNLASLMSSFEHRGPDDRGWLTWFEDGIQRGGAPHIHRGRVVLGHQRLSILDLTDSGHQPMSSADDRYHIVYNGEIYNFIELRKELEQLGRKFFSSSDTEVLIAAWAEWGERALNRFEGMFAFVLFDRVEKRLYAARDHFGIKPLAFCEWRGGLALCSEISTLKALADVDTDLDAQTAYDYLVHGVSEHCERTFYRGIRQLLPAHLLVIDVQTSSVIRNEEFWSLGIEENEDLSFSQAAAAVRDLFLQNVERHLRSDVPVGAALSGGIDSSAILCAIREIHPRADLHAFSYIADQQSLSEESWIDLVGRHTKATVHKVRATSGSLEVDLPDLMRAQNVPFGSTSIYAQFKIFESAARNGIKVMLDGQGADETLAGYFGYRANALIGLLAGWRLLSAAAYMRSLASTYSGILPGVALRAASAMVPESMRPALRRSVGKELVPSWLNARWFNDRGVQVAPRSSYRWSRHSLRHSLVSSIQHASLPHLLRYEDRNSMFHSVESRVPFLTPKLVSLILSLPPTYIIDKKGTTKSVFREAMKPFVPSEILSRTDKIGFGTPEAQWLTHEKSAWVTAILNRSNGLGLFNSPELARYWQAVVAGIQPYSTSIWRSINLIQWHQSSLPA